MRVRIQFAKTDAMRFTSHLDLHRTWERTIRRAGLPLAYSQGFHPNPRISLASALPLGFTGDCELVDVWLETPLPTVDIHDRLSRAAPPGLHIHQVQEIDLRTPTLQSALIASKYCIIFPEYVADLAERVADLLSKDSLPRLRRGKQYDLRPLILNIQTLPDQDDERSRIAACLQAREGATGRPEEVILALGLQPEICQVVRTRLILQG